MDTPLKHLPETILIECARLLNPSTLTYNRRMLADKLRIPAEDINYYESVETVDFPASAHFIRYHQLHGGTLTTLIEALRDFPRIDVISNLEEESVIQAMVENFQNNHVPSDNTSNNNKKVNPEVRRVVENGDPVEGFLPPQENQAQGGKNDEKINKILNVDNSVVNITGVVRVYITTGDEHRPVDVRGAGLNGHVDHEVDQQAGPGGNTHRPGDMDARGGNDVNRPTDGHNGHERHGGLTDAVDGRAAGYARGEMGARHNGHARGEMDARHNGHARGEMDARHNGCARGEMDAGHNGFARGEMDARHNGFARGEMDARHNGCARGEMDARHNGFVRGEMDARHNGFARGELPSGGAVGYQNDNSGGSSPSSDGSPPCNKWVGCRPKVKVKVKQENPGEARQGSTLVSGSSEHCVPPNGHSRKSSRSRGRGVNSPDSSPPSGGRPTGDDSDSLCDVTAPREWRFPRQDSNMSTGSETSSLNSGDFGNLIEKLIPSQTTSAQFGTNGQRGDQRESLQRHTDPTPPPGPHAGGTTQRPRQRTRSEPNRVTIVGPIKLLCSSHMLNNSTDVLIKIGRAIRSCVQMTDSREPVEYCLWNQKRYRYSNETREEIALSLQQNSLIVVFADRRYLTTIEHVEQSLAANPDFIPKTKVNGCNVHYTYFQLRSQWNVLRQRVVVFYQESERDRLPPMLGEATVVPWPNDLQQLMNILLPILRRRSPARMYLKRFNSNP